jgi:cbb3-type cytochrome oxidase maturation protein
MSYLAWLVPIALGMGLAGLVAFLWSMRSGQYEDLDGAAERVLLSGAADAPLRQDGVKNEEALHRRPDKGNALSAEGVHSTNTTERARRD